MLDKLERIFGSWAIPGIIRYLAILFVGVFLMSAYRPAFGEALDFDYPKIVSGEWWRCITFIFASSTGSFNFLSLLFLVFGTLLLFTFSDGLEEQWGVFRTNLFVLWGFMSTLLANWVFAYFLHSSVPMSGVYLGLSIFFAFATFHPKFTLRVLFFIPCPIWVIAVITGVLMLLLPLIGNPLYGGFVLICISNYLVVAIPRLLGSAKQRSQTQMRRQRFENQFSESRKPFHICHVCGANDVDNPEKDFRVGKDGRDYCTDHLPK